jgi:hypothetical protein
MHDLILYSTDDGQVALQPRASVWLSQLESAEPFVSGKQHTSLRIRTIPDQGALSPAALKQSLTVRDEGGRQLYNLDSPSPPANRDSVQEEAHEP